MALRKYFALLFLLLISINFGLAEAKNSGNEYLCKLIDEGNIEKVIKSIKRRQGKTRMSYYDSAITYAQEIGNKEIVDALYEAIDDEEAEKERLGFCRRHLNTLSFLGGIAAGFCLLCGLGLVAIFNCVNPCG